MAGASSSITIFLLFINFVLYFIISVIAGWAINYSIENSPQTASDLVIPVQLFPIYFPVGNYATGFFVIFSLIAGVFGMASSITGINDIIQWTVSNLMSAATFATTTWLLTLLAMGLACKEIQTDGRDGALSAMEALIIVLSGTQLFCMVAIHSIVSTFPASSARRGA